MEMVILKIMGIILIAIIVIGSLMCTDFYYDHFSYEARLRKNNPNFMRKLDKYEEYMHKEWDFYERTNYSNLVNNIDNKRKMLPTRLPEEKEELENEIRKLEEKKIELEKEINPLETERKKIVKSIQTDIKNSTDKKFKRYFENWMDM